MPRAMRQWMGVVAVVAWCIASSACQPCQVAWLSTAKQYVDGTGAAVDSACGRECHDVQVPAQPQVYRRLEYRAARSGTIAFAVDDAHAAASWVTAARDEIGEPIASGRLVQAVKIQFILGRIQSTPQPAHHLIAHAGTLKGQRLTA